MISMRRELSSLSTVLPLETVRVLLEQATLSMESIWAQVCLYILHITCMIYVIRYPSLIAGFPLTVLVSPVTTTTIVFFLEGSGGTSAEATFTIRRN